MYHRLGEPPRETLPRQQACLREPVQFTEIFTSNSESDARVDQPFSTMNKEKDRVRVDLSSINASGYDGIGRLSYQIEEVYESATAAQSSSE